MLEGFFVGDVVQLRDFERREENDAALVRLAKEVMGLIDAAPCEMPPVEPSSSSLFAMKTMSRLSATPLRLRRSIAMRCAIPSLFMSSAPRP